MWADGIREVGMVLTSWAEEHVSVQLDSMTPWLMLTSPMICSCRITAWLQHTGEHWPREFTPALCLSNSLVPHTSLLTRQIFIHHILFDLAWSPTQTYGAISTIRHIKRFFTMSFLILSFSLMNSNYPLCPNPSSFYVFPLDLLSAFSFLKKAASLT